MSRIGSDISSQNLLDVLAQDYATASRQHRKQKLAEFVDLLMELGSAAGKDSGELERASLELIGNFSDFVLKGTLQQQVACKLATHLGFRRADEIPKSVLDCVVIPMIKALIEVLRLGAPTTRDAAVEGLGALLKLVDDPAAQFRSDEALKVVRETGEKDEDYHGRFKISEQYFARLDRRRLMALTIAGHSDSSAKFIEKLKEPVDHKLARMLGEPEPWEKVEHALNEHSDLLRILPAMARQGQDLPPNATGLLCAAAGVLTVGEDAPPAAVVAMARFQESVFRTIDTAMRRRSHWRWDDFDEVVAAAVYAIPQSIGGPPSVCNGQIRATVAILRTAIRLVIASGGSSRTKEAIEPLFRDIGTHMRWSNLGIVEGCYRGLPDLVTKPEHNDLTALALETLFTQLRHPHKSEDPVEIHRHLIANACFRRMLILVAGRGQQGDQTGALKVEHQLRLLLRDPTPENILRTCQRDEDVKSWPTAVMPTDAAHTIIAGIAFESELLRRSKAMFQSWNFLLTVEKVLLTRILAAQLHEISRDAPEMERHPALKRIFSGIDTISMTDAKAMDALWELLSSLPPNAAESADAEVQRFVEYRGCENSDLPGYVLAMISPSASGRIAGAIAREIDLNIRRERRGGKSADFAKSLHQVMLRGPHQSVFDHLLPRIQGGKDRALVLLFRKHVANVLHAKRSGDVFDLSEIRTHVKALFLDLESQTSPTLRKLREALDLFVKLTGDEMSVWTSLTTDITTLFICLDGLAAKDDFRTPLYPTLRHELAKLQEEVKDYADKPVGDFPGRRKALTKAGRRASSIGKSLAVHEGLQPPERSLLIALMQHFHDLFGRTIDCYCDTARRFREANDQTSFWLHFCDENSRVRRIADAKKLNPGPERNHAEELIRNEPPPFRTQRAKFEEYYVEWMSSELDVDSLKEVLHKRWPPWFQIVYAVITNFWLTSLLILAPCGIAIVADYMGYHSWEGAGFFVLTFGLFVTAMLSFTQVIHILARLRRRNKEHEKPGYWFPCLMPRLARLTAVPMALIVEFDHSYEFPLGASSWALLLLMVTSFVTTRFFVTREMVDRKEQPGVVKITPAESRRVKQIVGLALATSFGIAVLLSAIFAPSHERRPPPETGIHRAAGATSSFWKLPVAILDHLDATSKRHPRPRFLGLIPREVSFDVGRIAELQGYSLPPRIREIVGFRFYPTVILTWTALGLFFGVFLEGFMGGKRLRGGWPGSDS